MVLSGKSPLNQTSTTLAKFMHNISAFTKVLMRVCTCNLSDYLPSSVLATTAVLVTFFNKIGKSQHGWRELHRFRSGHYFAIFKQTGYMQ